MFGCKMKIFTGIILYFSYFCLRHRLLVHVRTASANEYPQSMLKEQKKKKKEKKRKRKKKYTPAYPIFAV